MTTGQIHVPLITPFGADGRVDAAALVDLAHEVLAEGAAGLVALGTTAEAAALDDAERAEVTRLVGRVCRERGARFTVGVGAGSTRRAARELDALGGLPVVPDAALVTVPAFTRPGEAGVVAHFRALAGTSPVPLLVYHVPHRTGQPLSAAALLALAATPGIAGVKYATGGLDAEAVDLLGALTVPGAGTADGPGTRSGARSGDGDGNGDGNGDGGGQGGHGDAAGGRTDTAGFEVLAGDDVMAPALFALGAHGGILASAHLATARWAELPATGDRILGHRLAALAAALFQEPNPAVIKAVLHARGRIPTPDVRLPLLPATPAGRDAALVRLAALDGPGEAAPAAPAAATGRLGT